LVRLRPRGSPPRRDRCGHRPRPDRGVSHTGSPAPLLGPRLLVDRGGRRAAPRLARRAPRGDRGRGVGLSGKVSPGTRVTRGKGRLEAFLARHRAQMANRLIPDELRGGTIVDIGCGSYPYFLSTVDFARRVGLDRFVSAGAPDAVEPGVAAAAPPGAGSATAVSPLGSTPARGPD